MNDRAMKSIWALTSAFLLCCFVAIADSQEHRFPTTRRRLPTVIITREHLRQQHRTPSLYGPIGDTAAEFVVSAGLDDRPSSAVRIRKIGSNDGSNRRNNGDNISLRNNAGSNRRDEIQGDSRNNFESNNGNIQVNQRNNAGSGHRENFSNSRRHNMDGNRRNNFVGNNAESSAANDTSSNEVNDRHQVISVHHRRRPELRPVNFANDRNRGNGPQVLSSDGRQPHPYNGQEVFNPQIVGVSVERRHPELHPQANRRRQDIHHQRNRVGDSQRFYPAVNVNFERGPQQYVPPIFVPNYQTHRNGQPIIPTDQRGYVNSRPTVNSKPVYIGEPNEKTESISNPSPNASPAIVTEEKRVHATSEDNRDPVLKTNDDEVNDDIKKAPHKHIVAETPVLRLKPADAQKYLIRRPSLVLTDQITVNEVRGPRFGPRSLEHDQEESTTGSRQKRRAPSSLYSLAHVELNRTTGHPKVERQFTKIKKPKIIKESNNETEPLPTIKKALHGFRDRGQRKSKSHPFRNYSGHQDTSSNSSTFTKPSLFDTRTPYYSDEFVSDQSSDSSSKQSDLNDEDVMSFSDFLASPIAEKIRLERQKMFRNSSRWTSDPNDYSYPNSTVDLESSMENTSVPALQEMIAAKLLHNILSINNSYSENETTAHSDPRMSRDNLSSAEQRHFGILVSPYDSIETLPSRNSMPIVRILRGKIVPIPDLPQELIPILLGTYRPTHTSETSLDDPKMTENVLDDAILSLLQGDDNRSGRPMASNNKDFRRPPETAYEPWHPGPGPRYNRKSPSTNHVGSLKASEPHGLRTSYSFGPPGDQWSMGPRCDRLTEEICLDDSDYPSSAILSSIYKDKAKFDLMYAEVKVRESQVEGLSRQQEQAYTFDHYYGQQSSASQVSNLDPRDYGHGGGFVCPSEVHYGRPHRAKNRRGEWKVVVNVGEYTQTLRMEKCLASGNPCKYVVAHMQSTCSQVYSYHRLLVFSKDNGLHIDLFRVPTGCACHLRKGGYQQTYSEPVPYLAHRPTGQHHYEEFGGHVETAPVSQTTDEGPQQPVEKKPPSFGSTLWAILGGGPQAGALSQQPQFQDEVKKNIGWTQHVKHLPHMLKQVSPDQVLKQLLDMDDNDDYDVRRLRIRTKPGNNGGYASHLSPVSVPLPPPPPPRAVIARRPVVTAATQDVFGRHRQLPAKVIAISDHPPAKIYSFSKDGLRITETTPSNHQQKVRADPNLTYQSEQSYSYGARVPSSDQQFQNVKAYKITPGMFHPQQQSGEKLQFSEDEFSTGSQDMDQYTTGSRDGSMDSGSIPGLRPVLRPMKNSDRVVEDADLIAIEKSEDGQIHAFKVVESVNKNDSAEDADDEDSRMNFSYHPILEYLNM